ncbi:MAG TPA: hypothetical protein VF127_05035 [Nitrospira sp.]
MSMHDYKGHQITLIPSPEGSLWACQYVIRATGRTEVDGFPGRTYFSREEAESAALARAKWWIDDAYHGAQHQDLMS